MRRSISILVAAAFSVVGTAISFAPAQAAIKAPAAVNADGSSSVVQVHKRKRHHRHRRGRVIYVVPHYVPVYPAYRSYRHYGHYGHYGHHGYGYRPGVSLNFSFGGGRGYHHW